MRFTRHSRSGRNLASKARTGVNPRGPHVSGGEALRAALKRLARVAPPPANGAWPVPESPWERAAEARLSKIEQQLSNQNRLLLITLVSILADVALGLAR